MHVRTALATGVAVVLLAAPLAFSKPVDRHHRDGCADVPRFYDASHASAFARARYALETTNFTAFDDAANTFGHTFAHAAPARLLARELAVYGYDFVGAYGGYLLFYRRAAGSWQPSTMPPIVAPNGELIPSLPLPPDLNPAFPAPDALVAHAPFVGGVVLSQQIVAFPCDR